MLNNHPHPVLKLKAEHYGNILWIGMFFAVIDILTSSFSMSTCKYWHQTEKWNDSKDKKLAPHNGPFHSPLSSYVDLICPIVINAGMDGLEISMNNKFYCCWSIVALVINSCHNNFPQFLFMSRNSMHLNKTNTVSVLFGDQSHQLSVNQSESDSKCKETLWISRL